MKKFIASSAKSIPNSKTLLKFSNVWNKILVLSTFNIANNLQYDGYQQFCFNCLQILW